MSATKYGLKFDSELNEQFVEMFTGSSAFQHRCRSPLPIPSKFKDGDIVQFNDYSFSKGLFEGKLSHDAAYNAIGVGLGIDRKCEVIAVGLADKHLPVDNSSYGFTGKQEVNDCVVQHIKTGAIIFTQVRFLKPCTCPRCNKIPGDQSTIFCVKEGVEVCLASPPNSRWMIFQRSTGKRVTDSVGHFTTKAPSSPYKRYTVLSRGVVVPCAVKVLPSNDMVLMDRYNGDIIYAREADLRQPKCPECGALL